MGVIDFISVAHGTDDRRGLWLHHAYQVKDQTDASSPFLIPYRWGTLDQLHYDDGHNPVPGTVSSTFFKAPVVFDNQGPLQMVYVSSDALQFLDLPEDGGHVGGELEQVELVESNARREAWPEHCGNLPARAFLGDPEDIASQVCMFATMIDLKLGAAKAAYLGGDLEAGLKLQKLADFRHEIAIYQRDIETYTDTALLWSKLKWVLAKGSLRSLPYFVDQKQEKFMGIIQELHGSDKAVRAAASEKVEVLTGLEREDFDLFYYLYRMHHYYFSRGADSDSFQFPYQDFESFIAAVDEYTI